MVSKRSVKHPADALVIICISALTLSNAEAKKFLN